MRISDWSSDVCSSDLVDWAAGHLRRHHGAVPEVHAEEREQLRQAAFADLDAVVEIVQQGVSFGVQPDVPDPALVGDLLHRLNGDANVVEVRDPALQHAAERVQPGAGEVQVRHGVRSEEHTSELQSLMRIAYA